MSSQEPAGSGFEATLARLEKTIAQLADGSAPLDELVAAHQRAAGLLAEAEERLETLKARAELLARSLAE
ncbi:MAG TPA: exodeoxyribonuclease VII small subunit [Candidatus Dormibacteraeota bacterium]|nr:exodeoxyribonuclease VII small subunit [Candidatus Dormibacteraeota bacterium]